MTPTRATAFASSSLHLFIYFGYVKASELTYFLFLAHSQTYSWFVFFGAPYCGSQLVLFFSSYLS